ncbi:MAG: peptide ABC transporter substrate-binding protein [Pirellulaceae bacterium]|nr:MAG: peptide ABC transporter substrate-binding protein [Pirellulaceae bacterium]
MSNGLEPRTLSRRMFMRLSAFTAAGTVLAACSGGGMPAPLPQAEATTTPAASEGTAGAAPSQYNEAPMLAELVAQGQLPPVDERLPEEPLVLEPVEEVGQYGGIWHKVDSSDSLGWTRQTIMVEPFLKWNRDASGMRSNLVTSWEWNEDATQLTVHFRRGIQWSDGVPLTVDDYLFWWNDMVLNENVPVNPPHGTTVGGQVMQVEKVDDYTLQYSFAAPNPLFLEYHSRGHYHSAAFVVPAHYMKQFHPDYNDEVTDTEELMARYDVASRLHYPDMPTFMAWKPVEFLSGQRAVFERNPYYWKVDTAGNQLPYIDRIEIDISETGNPAEFVALKAIAGELDMQVREIALKDVPLILENAEAGDYRVLMWNRGDYAWPWLILMYDYPDEGIVDLMYTPEFRRALSYAINRERINNIVALGLAKPRQFALSPESPEFQTPEGQQIYAEWVSSYADYDPEQAAALLDQIGVVDTNGDGMRERPDGSPLELIVDVLVTDQKSIDSMDLIKEDWEAVGLKTVINAIAGEIMNQRAQAGEIMIRAWGSAAAWGLVSAPTVWAPVEGVTYCLGGVRLGQYYQSGGAAGIPPRSGSALEKLQQAYTDIISTADPAERRAKLLDAYRIHIEEGPLSIGTVGEHVSPAVVKNNFRNVPEFGLVAGWDLGYPGSADPEQFFIRP